LKRKQFAKEEYKSLSFSLSTSVAAFVRLCGSFPQLGFFKGLNSNHTQDPKSEAFSRTGTPAAAAAATRKKNKKEKEILPRRSVQHGKIV
jgi:hypothetical protein